jgi:quinol monooxygenase YgiN
VEYGTTEKGCGCGRFRNFGNVINDSLGVTEVFRPAFFSGLSKSGGKMAIRLIVMVKAAAGKGAELAEAYKARCAEVTKESGCEQFEVFQSVVNPDKFALLERWTDQGALDAHAKVQNTRTPLRPDLRAGGTEREDYTYNRTR